MYSTKTQLNEQTYLHYEFPLLMDKLIENMHLDRELIEDLIMYDNYLA